MLCGMFLFAFTSPKCPALILALEIYGCDHTDVTLRRSFLY